MRLMINDITRNIRRHLPDLNNYTMLLLEIYLCRYVFKSFDP